MPLLDVRLLGDGVELRPIVRGDGEEIFASLSTDPGIAARTRIPWPYTRAHLHGFLDQVDAWRAGSSDLVCAITLPGDDTMIGSCGVHRIGAVAGARSALLPDEVGYWLAGTFRGRGIMRRAVSLLCSYALTDLGLTQLNLQTKVGNVESQRVARAVGFRFTETVLRDQVIDDDVDHDRFVLTVDAYEAKHGPVVAPSRSGL